MIEDKFDLNDIPTVGIYEHIASCDMGDVYMSPCDTCSYYKDGCKKPKEVKCSHCEKITALYTTSAKKQEYRCAYCGTIHENRQGNCLSCGAPLSEAVEI